MSNSQTIIRDAGEGERRWFFGGGLHIWKARSAETGGAFFALEDVLTQGKVTPLHHHPDQDELLYVIEGELLYKSRDSERRVGQGATIVTPRGVPHAFMVLSESARVLSLQAPGDGEAFYLAASEPAGETAGRVDFAKIREAAESTGVTVVLGPPPFKKP